MIKNRPFSILYKMILICIVSYALFLETYTGGKIQWGAFYFFTIQSNALVVLCLLLLLTPINRAARFKAICTGMVLLAVTATGLVYNFILYRIFTDWGTVGYTFPRTVTHVVSPLGFILNWLLFEKHRAMYWRDAIVWMIYPALYGCVSLIVSAKTGKSLYFFLDITNGFMSNAKWISLICISLLFISLVYIVIDKWIKNIN